MADKKLLKAIASRIADYRKGEIGVPDADHVDQWISQFDDDVQDPILHEVNHVLERTYITRSAVNDFLKEVSSHKDITGAKPKQFWKEATILNIQRNGSSQKEMLQVFGEILKKEHGVDIDDGPSDSPEAVYIDDVVFGGGHVRGDLVDWIKTKAPNKVRINIIVVAYHLGGQWFAGTKIMEAAKSVGKKVELRWARIHAIEDRKSYINGSDVLRPVKIPDHKPTKAYVKMLTDQRYAPLLRTPGSIGPAKFYSGEEGRNLLEQQFLMKGTDIRTQSPLLNEYQRPLGNMVLKTLGFGAMIVTFRNCANNCPLALWAGDPWYPLFPRKTN